MPYAQRFHRFFADQVDPLMQGSQWAEAVEVLESHFSSMPTREDRAEIYHWLGVVHGVMGAEALQDRDAAAARDHVALREEFLVKALEQDANRVETRTALARHFLWPAGEAARALPFLDAVEQDRSLETTEDFFAAEHKRRALRGACLVMLARVEEGAAELEAAYGEEFRGRVPRGPDLAPLTFIAHRDSPLPARTMEALEASLAAWGVDPRRAEAIMGRLRG